MQVRITVPVARVLRVFLDDIGEQRYGFELMREAGLASGTLYPILARLEQAGWLTGEMEPIDPEEAGRPARRFYRLTAEGARSAHFALAELDAQLRRPGTGGLIRPRRDHA
ncbi:helix-turn-helix transcriptional regulator [Actinomadura sp. GC306]|uniref:PadR family transcriptional regulator n=1 Tax=Actinomadura sp. GC306 TaxID=2530367 RepID=UPI001A9D5C2D|nr:helix-turn-helix transcriptional regulator [Actinomadura sp. GC306]